MKIKYSILGVCTLLLIVITLVTNASYCKYRDINIKTQVDQFFWETILNYEKFKVKQLNVPCISIQRFQTGENKSLQSGVRITTSISADCIRYNDSIKNPENKELRGLYIQHSYMNTEGYIDIVQIDSIFREKLIEQGIKTKTLSTYKDLSKGKIYHSQKDTSSFSNKDICSNTLNIGINLEIEYKTQIKYPYCYVIKILAIENFPYLIVISILISALIYLCILKRTLKLRAIENEKREKEIEILVETAKREEKERIEEKIRETKSQHALLAEEVDNINNVCRTLNYCYKGKMLRTLSRQNKELMSLFLHKPHHTLLQSEIVIGLWGGMVNGYKERLKKCIQRFRENIDEFMPELKLITIKGEGYMLEIPNPDDIDEIVVIEPLNFQGTPEELNKVRKIEIQKIKAVEDSKKQKEKEQTKNQDITKTDSATEN